MKIKNDKFKTVAGGTRGQYLLEYLEEVKREVSDVRNPLKVKPEIDREVRLAVCDVIDDLLVAKIKFYRGTVENNTERYD